MSRKVWKVTLHPLLGSPQTHQLPFGAKVVHVDRDPGNPGAVAVWFECDPVEVMTGTLLWLVGTDHEIPGLLQHIGTAVIDPFVWHVYMGRK